MKLMLTLNGAERQIEVLAAPPACRFRLDDETERIADVATPAPSVYSILIDGRSYDVQIEQTPQHLVVVLAGQRFEIGVRDPRKWSRQLGGRGGDKLEIIAAPMPGKVVRVLVAPGDTVEAGQGILVVEAMKMQNEMKVGRAGRVLTVSAREGATVTAGETLATIGPA